MSSETYANSQDGNDCVVRALANASGMAYEEAHALCKEAGRKDGRGMHNSLWIPLFEKKMKIEESGYLSGFGSIKTLSTKLAERGGTYIVWIRGHVAVFKNGEWIDWLNSNRRHRIRKVWRVEA